MKNILIIAAHPDDEILGCGGTILKNISLKNKVNVLYISDGVGGRYENKFDKKRNYEINERKNMAIKASKYAKFKIVDFLGLENLELNKYKNIFINDKIFKVLKQIKPDAIFTNHPGDNNIDHRITFESTFTACRPNNYFKIKEFYTYEIPSSTDWARHRERSRPAHQRVCTLRLTALPRPSNASTAAPTPHHAGCHSAATAMPAQSHGREKNSEHL